MTAVLVIMAIGAFLTSKDDRVNPAPPKSEGEA
jgi:hypothetical protein